MCRSLDHTSFRRCKRDDRARAMAAARRRILRAEKEISTKEKNNTLTKERHIYLLDKILAARTDLAEARKMKPGTNLR